MIYLKDTRLVQLPLNSDLWSQFYYLHNTQGSTMVNMPMPQQGTWVCAIVNKLPILVVGMCIYDTDGPFIVAEHLVSNPTFSAKTRFAAFDLTLNLLRAYATMKGKWIIAHPSKTGLARYLVRRGFSRMRVDTLVSSPSLAVP